MVNLSNWRSWLGKIPAPAMLIVTVLCLGLQENFPFSHFPMYSRMDDNTNYIYISDNQDRPLPIATLTSHRTGKLKKIYQSHLNDERDAIRKRGGKFTGFSEMTLEERRPAGERTLAWIYENTGPMGQRRLKAARPLRFHEVEVRMLPDKTLERKDYAVAELP